MKLAGFISFANPPILLDRVGSKTILLLGDMSVLSDADAHT